MIVRPDGEAYAGASCRRPAATIRRSPRSSTKRAKPPSRSKLERMRAALRRRSPSSSAAGVARAETAQQRFAAATALEAKGQFAAAADALEQLGHERPTTRSRPTRSSRPPSSPRSGSPIRRARAASTPRWPTQYPSSRLSRRARTRADFLARSLTTGEAPLREYDDILAGAAVAPARRVARAHGGAAAASGPTSRSPIARSSGSASGSPRSAAATTAQRALRRARAALSRRASGRCAPRRRAPTSAAVARPPVRRARRSTASCTRRATRSRARPATRASPTRSAGSCAASSSSLCVRLPRSCFAWLHLRAVCAARAPAPRAARALLLRCRWPRCSSPPRSPRIAPSAWPPPPSPSAAPSSCG